MKSPLSPAAWFLSVLLMSSFGEAEALPFAYITNLGDNTVSVIDTADSTVAATISVGDFPYGVAVNAAGTAVYVANLAPPFAGTLSVLDTALNAEAAEVGIGFAPQGVAVSPDGTRVFVSNSGGDGSKTGTGTVSIIDAGSRTVIGSIAVGKQPQGIAVSPDGRGLYVANNDQPLGTVAVVDLATSKVIKKITVGHNPQGLAVTPDGKWVYVANQCGDTADCIAEYGTVTASGTVSVIDTTALRVVATVQVDMEPFGVAVAVTADGPQVLVTNTFSDDVWIIDASTAVSDPESAVLGTIDLDSGSSPRGIAVTRDGMTAYVAEYGTDSVGVIDVEAQSVITSIPVGSGPIALGNFIGPACLSNADCDDGNPCTDDTCDFQLGCVTTYNSATCDDGNPCTVSDACQGGVCVGSAALADGTSCDDGNPCTGNDACYGGTCVGQPVADGSQCDDGNACTTSDACQGGVCVGGPPPNCDDGNDCTVDSCDPASGCVHTLPGDVVGAGSVSLVFANQPIPQPYTGTITFNDTAYNFNCQAVNLATTVGTQAINGYVLSLDGITGTGTSVFHTESSPPGLLSDDGSATFICPSAVPSGSCTGSVSFVGTLSNVTGSAALPGDLTYTFDGFTDHPSAGTYVGQFALNAFAPVDTPEGSQVMVSSNATFFNSAIAGTPGLGSPVVPVKTHLTYTRVLKRGKTLVTAASNAAHTVPQEMWDMSADVKTNYLTTNYAIESGGFRGTILKPSTTAQVNNPITVCSHYEDADNDGVLDGTSISVSRLRLMRSQNKTFVDVTSRLDTAAHLVCAQVNSLATFATAVYTGELGSVPPDLGSLTCENRVAAKIKTLAKSVTTCHTRAATRALKGKPFDESGCEAAAKARYNEAVAKFIATCPACLQNKVALIRDQLQSSVDQANGSIYCAANETGCENAVANKLKLLTSALKGCRSTAATKAFHGRQYDQQKCESAAKSAYSKAVSRFIGNCPPCLQANQSLVMNAAASSLDDLTGEVYCAQ